MNMNTLTFQIDSPDLVTLSEGTQDKRPSFTGLAVPLGVPSSPSQDGYRYQFDGPPDNPEDLVDAVREHDEDALVGRLSAPWDPQDTGLHATARIFNTSRGRDVLEEAREGARTGFSVGAVVKKFTEKAGIRHVAAGDWTAQHLGIVRRPAFSTAGFQVTASAAPEGKTMTTTTAETPTGTRIEQLETPTDLPTVAELAELVAEHLGDKRNPAAHPLAQFATFSQFCAEFQTADTEKRTALQTAFAVPDQITSDNPGVMAPTWRTDIKSFINRRRPAITAFGGAAGLPGSGLEVNWPYLDPTLDIDNLIAQQTAEKQELSGAKIKILKGSESIKTAGAVSDISYQLILRSSPSYMAAYYQVLTAAWARWGEAQFEAKLLSAGTAAGDMPDPTDAGAVRAWLFEASADVEDATGAPADVVLVDRDFFVALGSNGDLVNPKYGTQNVAGTADASTLRINVNGLEIRRAAFFDAGQAIVANSDAARYGEDGPKIATEEDVRKLGRDVAVWGMYEDGEVYMPAGVRVYTETGA